MEFLASGPLLHRRKKKNGGNERMANDSNMPRDMQPPTCSNAAVASAASAVDEDVPVDGAE